MTPTRPILRYYGGKWRLAPAIIAMMPAHAVYVEPFGGGGSVLLRKWQSCTEVYNDLNSEIVNVFKMLRDKGEELSERLRLTPYARDEYDQCYQPSEDDLENARRFIFRSTAGIGSDSAWRRNGFRTSLCDIKHSTARSWSTLPDHYGAIISRLKGVIIENRDAIKVMDQYDAPHTLHYVDPPYLAETRKRSHKTYAEELLSPEKHEKLLTFLQSLTGKVILSGYDHPLYHQLGWRSVKLAGRDQTNESTPETVWLNFQEPDTLL